MTFTTPDLCDAHEDAIGTTLQVVTPLFRTYGGRTSYCGQIVTLKVFEDNSLVRTQLGEPGQGKVLVVDGGGSLRCALLGDQLAVLAAKNGWEGVLVYGCIRDSVEIGATDLGVHALATHPQKSVKRGVGERDLTVTFAGVRFQPGHWLYADADGILLSQHPLVDAPSA